MTKPFVAVAAISLLTLGCGAGSNSEDGGTARDGGSAATTLSGTGAFGVKSVALLQGTLFFSGTTKDLCAGTPPSGTEYFTVSFPGVASPASGTYSIGGSGSAVTAERGTYGSGIPKFSQSGTLTFSTFSATRVAGTLSVTLAGETAALTGTFDAPNCPR